MEMTNVDPRELLQREILHLRTIVAGLSDADVIKPTACAGWRVADLITHLRLGTNEILQGLVSETDDPADRDALSYWKDWPPQGPTGFTDVRWLWAQTASYASTNSLKSHFDVSACAAQTACTHAPQGRVVFQSHVMETDHFLSTWNTEFAVHHFDLVENLERGLSPSEEVMRSLVTTLDALTESTRLERWDDLSFIRKSTGRERLNLDERRELGELSSLFPAFG